MGPTPSMRVELIPHIIVNAGARERLAGMPEKEHEQRLLFRSQFSPPAGSLLAMRCQIEANVGSSSTTRMRMPIGDYRQRRPGKNKRVNGRAESLYSTIHP